MGCLQQYSAAPWWWGSDEAESTLHLLGHLWAPAHIFHPSHTTVLPLALYLPKFVRCPERFPSLLALSQTWPFLTDHLFCLKVPRSCRANSCPRQLQAGSGQSLELRDWHNVPCQLLPLWLRREEFSGTGLWLGSFQICWTCLLSKPIQLPMKQLSEDSVVGTAGVSCVCCEVLMRAQLFSFREKL